MRKLFFLVSTLITLLTGLFFVNLQTDANALVKSDFVASNIMSDNVMTNKDSMSVSQIQTFLNSKVPVCDTQGLQTSEFGGRDINGDGRVQRYEWAFDRGYSPPFTCLKDFSEGGKSAAQIIYDVSQQFAINPQVLIVLLQKEQALVTDTWPIPGSSQYRTATGYGCPDTAPCDSEYYGLTNQLEWSGRMFRAILNDSPGWYTPYELGTNFIQFNPNASCGGSNVSIQNRTTQALYNYTPYQPNNAVLDWKFNGGPYPGSCGAYGNLNFFVYFSEWFGTTQGVRIIPVPIDSTTDKTGESALVGFKLSTRPSSPVTVEFKVTTPSNARVEGKSVFVFDSNNWNKPELNQVRIVGVNNSSLTGSLRYWLIPWSVSSADIRFNNMAQSSRGSASLIQQDNSSPAGVYRLANSTLNKYIFTASTIEAQELVNEGWVNQGISFYFCQSGETLVQRMTNETERRLVIDQSEAFRDLASQGFRVETPVFSASNSQGTVPVYWLYDETNERSLYSLNPNEGAANGFVNNGIAFQTCPNNNQQTVYRLVNTRSGDRLLTLSPSERDRAMYSLGYRYEQPGYFICDAGTIDVYRLVGRNNGDRLFTLSAAERDRAVQDFNYRDEGVGFKICNDGAIDVYRLVNRTNGDRLFTTSLSERDRAVQDFNYRDEGVGFKIP